LLTVITGSTSTQPSIETWVWDFGDGNTFGQRSSGLSVSHIFLNPGTYTVTGTVSNTSGSDTASVTVTVGDNPMVGASAANALEALAPTLDLDAPFGSVVGDALYTTGTTRNPACWLASLDFTCRAYNGNACLITPRHILFATHYPPSSPIEFVKSDGTLVSVAISSTQQVRPGATGTYGDLSLGTLASDVTGITPATLPPSNLADYWNPDKEAPTPAIILPVAIGRKARVVGMNLRSVWGPSSGYYVKSARYAYQPSGGDSGSPVFILIDGVPVLVSACFFANMGPAYHEFVTEIQALIGAYTLTLADLSGFTDLYG